MTMMRLGDSDVKRKNADLIHRACCANDLRRKPLLITANDAKVVKTSADG